MAAPSTILTIICLFLKAHLPLPAYAAPTQPNSESYSTRQEPAPDESWAIRNLTRVCSADDNLCEWNFVIDTGPPLPGDPDPVVVAYTAVQADDGGAVFVGKAPGYSNHRWRQDTQATPVSSSSSPSASFTWTNPFTDSVLRMTKRTLGIFSPPTSNNWHDQIKNTHKHKYRETSQHRQRPSSLVTSDTNTTALLQTPCRHFTYSTPSSSDNNNNTPSIPASRATTSTVTQCGVFGVMSGWTHIDSGGGAALLAHRPHASNSSSGGSGANAKTSNRVHHKQRSDEITDGFTVLSVVDAARGVLVWPAYSDAELLSAAEEQQGG